MRAAHAAVALGVLGGMLLATVVLSGRTSVPQTVSAALALDPPGPSLDRRRAEAVAALVAACMARHGLRWRPVVESVPSIQDPDLGPIDWARRWGFGVSTMIGRPGPASTDTPDPSVPDGVPSAERAAYVRALHGDGTAPGCQPSATEAVYGIRDRLLAALRPALVALDARIAADPAAARALEAWRSCVRPVVGGLALDRRSLPGALLERYARRSSTIDLGALAVAGLAALQTDERRVATAVAACEVAFAVDRAAAAAPHEAAFVAAHRAELRSTGAAIRAAQAALPTLPP